MRTLVTAGRFSKLRHAREFQSNRLREKQLPAERAAGGGTAFCREAACALCGQPGLRKTAGLLAGPANGINELRPPVRAVFANQPLEEAHANVCEAPAEAQAADSRAVTHRDDTPPSGFDAPFRVALRYSVYDRANARRSGQLEHSGFELVFASGSWHNGITRPRRDGAIETLTILPPSVSLNRITRPRRDGARNPSVGREAERIFVVEEGAKAARGP